MKFFFFDFPFAVFFSALPFLCRVECDPELMSNYVVALLEKELPFEQLRNECLQALSDLLGEGDSLRFSRVCDL